jgi:hypothetical protein
MRNFAMYVSFAALIACGKSKRTERVEHPIAPHLTEIKNSCEVALVDIYPHLKSLKVDDRGIKPEDKVLHLSHLNSMPEYFLRVFLEKSIGIHLIDGPITAFEEFSDLKGEIPRGWENTQLTWDSVAGAGTRDGTFLGDPNLSHNAISLAIHEASHSVDLALNFTWDNSEFREIFEEEKKKMLIEDERQVYRTSYPEEFFAVAMEEYYCGQESRSNLKRWYPRIFEFLQSKLEPAILSKVSDYGRYTCAAHCSSMNGVEG